MTSLRQAMLAGVTLGTAATVALTGLALAETLIIRQGVNGTIGTAIANTVSVLFDLEDVDGSPDDGDVLTYRQATSDWAPLPLDLSATLAGIETAGASAGDVLTWDGGQWRPQAPAGGARIVAYGSHEDGDLQKSFTHDTPAGSDQLLIATASFGTDVTSGSTTATVMYRKNGGNWVYCAHDSHYESGVTRGNAATCVMRLTAGSSYTFSVTSNAPGYSGAGRAQYVILDF